MNDLASEYNLSPATVSLSQYNSCIILNGLVACWGDNRFKQTDVYTKMHKQVAYQVAAGWMHTCFMAGLGNKLCVGSNCRGQLDVPPHAHGYSQIASGALHTCTLEYDNGKKKDKKILVCWGDATMGLSKDII